jgi:hypothetical protein
MLLFESQWWRPFDTRRQGLMTTTDIQHKHNANDQASSVVMSPVRRTFDVARFDDGGTLLT